MFAARLLPLLTLLSCMDLPRAPATLAATGAPRAVAPSRPRVLARLTLSAVGDVIPHGSIKAMAARADAPGADGQSQNHQGWGALLGAAAGALSAADVSFANLETPIAPDHEKVLASKIFNGPPALLDALRGAGVDVVSFANNHVYDQGRTGFTETLARLEDSGLAWVGAGATAEAAMAPRIFEVNGLKLGLIGSSRVFNANHNKEPDLPSVFAYDADAIASSAAEARAQGADLVVLSMHWGVEYRHAQRDWEIRIGHQLLEAGVDVILGHHPHVLQPVEVYETADGRTTVVAWSLGNFLSGQGLDYRHGLSPLAAGDTRDGAMLRLEVLRKDYGKGVERVELAGLSVEPFWADNSGCLDPAAAGRIRPVSTCEAATRLRQQLAETSDPEETVALGRCLDLFLSRRERAGGFLGAQWLAECPAAEPDQDGAAAP